MNDKLIVKNIGLSILLKPISMILMLIYTPLVLNYLDTEKYGVWAIILNILSWINYFDIGIGNGLKNKITETVANQEYDKTKKYVSSAYLGTTIVAVAFFLIISSAWYFLNLGHFFKVELSDENINIIFFISLFFVCVNFIISLSKTSAYAVHKPWLISLFDVTGQIIQIGLLLLLINTTCNSLQLVSIVAGTSTLISGVFLYFTITRGRDFLVPSAKDISKEFFAPLISLGLGFFVLQICGLVLNTTDSLIISRLYGSSDVTPYNIVFKVFNVIVQIHGIIIMPMWSAYTDASTRHEYQWIKNTMKRVNSITALFALGCVALIFVFEPLADFWLGKKIEYGFPLIVLVAGYTIFQMFANNYSALLCGVSYIKISVVLCAISALGNIPLSILFAVKCDMGVAGVVLGSVVVMSIGVIAGPLLAQKWLNNFMKRG